MALLGEAETRLIEIQPISYEFGSDTGVAEATDLVKLNYYNLYK